MNMTDVDFIALDNSDSPQLWAWAGASDDETSEALFRLPMDGIGLEVLALRQDLLEAIAAIENKAAIIKSLHDQRKRLYERLYDSYRDKNTLYRQLKLEETEVDDG